MGKGGRKGYMEKREVRGRRLKDGSWAEVDGDDNDNAGVFQQEMKERKMSIGEGEEKEKKGRTWRSVGKREKRGGRSREKECRKERGGEADETNWHVRTPLWTFDVFGVI